MKIKIYFGIIILLFGFLVYTIFFMKSDYENTSKLPSTIAGERIKPGEWKIEYYKPDFLPKPIPEDVLKGAEENDFYLNLFLNQNRKSVVYIMKKGSKNPNDSEFFHKQIDDYLTKVLYDGQYKNLYLTEEGIKIYEKNLLSSVEAANYTPAKGDSRKHIKKMEAEKELIDAVKAFREECTKTMCIINNKTKEYVVIDKRDVKTAKKALNDYRHW